MQNLNKVLISLTIFVIVVALIYFSGYRNGYVEGYGQTSIDTVFAPSDTVWDVQVIYLPTETGEATVEIIKPDETTDADSIHQIAFTVSQGTAHIDYNVETRHASYIFEPSAVELKTRTITNEIIINSVQYIEPPLNNALSKRDIGLGCIIGGVVAYGSVWLAGQL